jgi:hypothetical protein
MGHGMDSWESTTSRSQIFLFSIQSAKTLQSTHLLYPTDKRIGVKLTKISTILFVPHIVRNKEEE